MEVHPKIIATIQSCVTPEQLENCFSFIKNNDKGVWVTNRIRLLIEVQAIRLKMNAYNHYIGELKKIIRNA